MRKRVLAPLAILFLVAAGVATAAAAGVLESDDSGFDSPRDLAERGPAPSSPSSSLPDTSLPGTSLPGTSLPSTSLPGDGAGGGAIAVGETQTHAAGGAGTVTIRNDGATLTLLAVNANAGFTSEVEQGTGREIEVQFHNPTTRVDFNAELEDGVVRIRVRVRDDATATSSPGTLPGSDPVREDNSGPGNSHDDDDDNSGHGSGSSGSGSSGSGRSGDDD